MCEPAKPVSLAAAGLTVVLAYQLVESVAEAIALGVFAACAVSLVVLVRQLLMKPRLAANQRLTAAALARAALPAAPKAIAAPRVLAGVIIEKEAVR